MRLTITYVSQHLLYSWPSRNSTTKASNHDNAMLNSNACLNGRVCKCLPPSPWVSIICSLCQFAAFDKSMQPPQIQRNNACLSSCTGLPISPSYARRPSAFCHHLTTFRSSEKQVNSSSSICPAYPPRRSRPGRRKRATYLHRFLFGARLTLGKIPRARLGPFTHIHHRTQPLGSRPGDQR